MKNNNEISGQVVHGKGMGRKFGMPTANIAYKNKELLPKFGVYASKVYLGQEEFVGVTNVGLRPSVDDREVPTVEVHILDFNRMIYGQILRVELVHYLREIKKFEGLAQVKAQVDKDIKKTRELISLV